MRLHKNSDIIILPTKTQCIAKRHKIQCFYQETKDLDQQIGAYIILQYDIIHIIYYSLFRHFEEIGGKLAFGEIPESFRLKTET